MDAASVALWVDVYLERGRIGVGRGDQERAHVVMMLCTLCVCGDDVMHSVCVCVW